MFEREDFAINRQSAEYKKKHPNYQPDEEEPEEEKAVEEEMPIIKESKERDKSVKKVPKSKHSKAIKKVKFVSNYSFVGPAKA